MKLTRFVAAAAISLGLALCAAPLAYAEEATPAPSAPAPAPEPLKVTFDASGGQFGNGAATVTNDWAVGQKLPNIATPSRASFTFNGWYIGSTKVTPGSTVPSNTGSFVVWASWSPKDRVAVVFDENGGSGVGDRLVKPGAKIGTLPTPKRAGFTFMGWYTADHGGTLYNKNKKVAKKAGYLYLHAQWAPNAMFQSDGKWSKNPYMTTIGNSGCGPSAASIVARAFGTADGASWQTPATAASFMLANGYATMDYSVAKTTSAGMIAYLGTYGLKVTETTSAWQAESAVRSGNVVIARMNPGFWTQHKHYIVWYDISGSKALVRDPNGTKASKTANTMANLKKQAQTYFIVEIPYEKRIAQ